MPEPGNIPDRINKFLSGRTRGEGKFNEATRQYPFRLGFGPAASEDYLSGKRRAQMDEATRISNAVPRQQGDNRAFDQSDGFAFGKPNTE